MDLTHSGFTNGYEDIGTTMRLRVVIFDPGIWLSLSWGTTGSGHSLFSLSSQPDRILLRRSGRSLDTWSLWDNWTRSLQDTVMPRVVRPWVGGTHVDFDGLCNLLSCRGGQSLPGSCFVSPGFIPVLLTAPIVGLSIKGAFISSHHELPLAGHSMAGGIAERVSPYPFFR